MISYYLTVIMYDYTVDKIKEKYKFHWQDLRQLNRIYWVIVFNCALTYSGMTFYKFLTITSRQDTDSIKSRPRGSTTTFILCVLFYFAVWLNFWLLRHESDVLDHVDNVADTVQRYTSWYYLQRLQTSCTGALCLYCWWGSCRAYTQQLYFLWSQLLLVKRCSALHMVHVLRLGILAIHFVQF